MNSQRDTSAGSVLFVDDDDYVIKALVRLMRPYPSRVLTASSGEEALAILASQKVDVIVADSLTPPVTGIKLICMAKELCPAITPIILSGKTDLADAQQAKNDGVLHTYIRKPWDDKELIAIIQEAIVKSLNS